MYRYIGVSALAVSGGARRLLHSIHTEVKRAGRMLNANVAPALQQTNDVTQYVYWIEDAADESSARLADIRRILFVVPCPAQFLHRIR